MLKTSTKLQVLSIIFSLALIFFYFLFGNFISIGNNSISRASMIVAQSLLLVNIRAWSKLIEYVLSKNIFCLLDFLFFKAVFILLFITTLFVCAATDIVIICLIFAISLTLFSVTTYILRDQQ